MTAPHRLQDLADVLRLIETARVPRELALALDPYVRAKYDELWRARAGRLLDRARRACSSPPADGR